MERNLIAFITGTLTAGAKCGNTNAQMLNTIRDNLAKFYETNANDVNATWPDELKALTF